MPKSMLNFLQLHYFSLDIFGFWVLLGKWKISTKTSTFSKKKSTNKQRGEEEEEGIEADKILERMKMHAIPFRNSWNFITQR